MPAFLIVANQTLASPTLAAAVAERVERGDASFHVVVPATPVQHRLTWDEDESQAAAQERLDAVLRRLGDLGVAATGEIGASDPVAAACDALRYRQIDEVLLSTLPPGLSRWIGMDVPTRLRASTSVPVTVVSAPREPATSGAGSGMAMGENPRDDV
jgi:nucleotide-binding universal stress UspA family protein